MEVDRLPLGVRPAGGSVAARRRLVKGRGAWLATVAAVLGFLGMTTLPGMLITDWYAAGIGHEFGLEGTLAVEAHMQDTMWGIAGFGLPAFIGTTLCLPLITLALSRAAGCPGGRRPWWSPPTRCS